MTQTTPQSPGQQLPFLGPTSYSAVFSEDRTINGVGSPFQDEWLENEPADFPSFREGRVEEGAKILASLKDFPSFESMIEKWQDDVHGATLFCPWIMACLASVRVELYEPLLQPSRDQQEPVLIRLSSKLFYNGLKPLEVDGTWTLDQYKMSFNGPNTRWETVGMFFTAVGLASMKRAPQRVEQLLAPAGNMVPKVLARRMIDLGQACLQFCEEAGHLNDAEIWINCELSILTSVIEGDASQIFWRRAGDLISTCFAMGLHGEITVSPGVPFWLSEVRKRMKAAVYYLDKSVSTFVGRPPRMSRKYCSMQLPLGLGIESWRLEGRALQEAVEHLDAAGWDTGDSLRGVHWARCALICSMIREDVLELSLGTVPQDDPVVAQQISERLQDAWQSIPEHIRRRSNIRQPDNKDWYVPVQVGMDFRYNEFLLQRAMVRKLQTSSQKLLDIARELLTVTLNVVEQAPKIGRYWCDLPWIIAKFGLPTAGVLGLELLRQNGGISGSTPALSTSLPRSEVIQSLSNLVAQIKSAVQPEDGNYALCFRARKVIQRILDQVLQPEPYTASASHSDQPMDVNAEADITTNQLEWLGTKSELDFWSTLPRHPLLASSKGRRT